MVSVVLLGAWAAAAGPLYAATPRCEENKRCQSYSDQARALSKEGKLAEALAIYKSAYATAADPLLLFNLGRVNQKLGRYQEARGYYHRYLDAGAEGDPRQRERTNQYIAEVEQQLQQTQSSGPGLALVPGPLRPASMGQPVSRRPFYKTWGFWTATGIAVTGALALGLSLGLIYVPHQEYSIWRPSAL